MVQKETPSPAVRGRGRPRAYDPEVALARAGEVFWMRGFDAASLDELCAAMGINRPSLYAAFGDKQALYLKALGAYGRRSADLARRALAAGHTLRDALSGFYTAAIGVYLTGEPPRGCLFIGTALTPAVSDMAVREAVREALAGLELQLCERIGLSEDQLANGLTSRQAGAVATATLHSLAVRARTGDGREALMRLAADTVDMLCADE